MPNSASSSSTNAPLLANLRTTPSYLLSGTEKACTQAAIDTLQHFFCTNTTCQVCCVCRAITQKSYHGLTWLTPERQYTVDQIKIIHQKSNLQLQPDEHHFLVLEHVQRLNASSANSLLKVLEEPPPGYHFILLTQHPERLPDTIRSRCVHIPLTAVPQESQHPFIAALTNPFSCQPRTFTELAQKALPAEHESPAIIEQLLLHWSKTNQPEIINILLHAQACPPFSGNSKLFWRNLYMQMHHALYSTKQL